MSSAKASSPGAVQAAPALLTIHRRLRQVVAWPSVTTFRWGFRWQNARACGRGLACMKAAQVTCSSHCCAQLCRDCLGMRQGPLGMQSPATFWPPTNFWPRWTSPAIFWPRWHTYRFSSPNKDGLLLLIMRRCDRAARIASPRFTKKGCQRGVVRCALVPIAGMGTDVAGAEIGVGVTATAAAWVGGRCLPGRRCLAGR